MRGIMPQAKLSVKQIHSRSAADFSGSAAVVLRAAGVSSATADKL
jgi:hypothetical protein